MAMYYLFNMKNGENEGSYTDETGYPAMRLAGEMLGDWLIDEICEGTPDDYGLYRVEVHKLNDVKFVYMDRLTEVMRYICKDYIEKYGGND